MSTIFPEIGIPTVEAVGNHTLTFWLRQLTTTQKMTTASLSTVQNMVMTGMTEHKVTAPLKSSWTLAPQSVTALSHDTGDPELASQSNNQHS